LSDGTHLNCQFSHYTIEDATTKAQNLNRPKAFVCPNQVGASLVLSNSFTWTAIKTDPSGNPVSLGVVEAKREGQTLFKAPTLPGTNGKSLTQESASLHALGAMISTNPMEPSGKAMAEPAQGEKETPEFKALRDALKQKLDTKITEVDKQLRDEAREVRLTFDGGQTTQCRKAPSTEESKDCPYYLCDPIKLNGQSFSPLLRGWTDIPISTVTNWSITLFGATEAGPSINIRAIEGTHSDSLLYSQPIIGMGPPPTPQGIPLPPGVRADSVFTPSPWQDNTRDSQVASCDSAEVRNRIEREKAWIRSQTEKMNQTQLAVVVNQIGDSLQTIVTRRELLPPDACNLFGDVWLSKEAASTYPLASPPLVGMNPEYDISPEEAERLFQEAAAMDDIPFKYVDDGCYARAEKMIERLQKEGVHLDKVFASGGMLQAGEQIEWAWHVAPVVWVREKDGSRSSRVIDPSLMKHAVTASEWLAAFHPSGVQGDALTVAWPDTPSTAPYNRTILYFTPPEVYWPGTRDLPTHQQIEENKKNEEETLKSYMAAQKEM
jgi:hypothetical protein